MKTNFLSFFVILFFFSFQLEAQSKKCYYWTFEYDKKYTRLEVDCDQFVKDHNKKHAKVDSLRHKENIAKRIEYQKMLIQLGYNFEPNGELSSKFIKAHHKYLRKKQKEENKLSKQKPPSVDVAIHKVYKTVLDNEFNKEINTDMVAIVDRSMGKTRFDSQEYNFIINDTIDQVFWRKSLFPRANYIDGSVVSSFKEFNPEEYQKLVKLNSGYGWYELWMPEFSDDRVYATINVKFFFANRDAITFRSIVKWENKKYRVIKTERIDLY